MLATDAGIAPPPNNYEKTRSNEEGRGYSQKAGQRNTLTASHFESSETTSRNNANSSKHGGQQIVGENKSMTQKITKHKADE